jgi:hypothetical protein
LMVRSPEPGSTTEAQDGLLIRIVQPMHSAFRRCRRFPTASPTPAHPSLSLIHPKIGAPN